MAMTEANLRPQELTDAGNAELFHALFQDDFLYNGKSTVRGNWYHWDGHKWTVDNHAAMRCAMQLAAAMLEQARERLTEAEEELSTVKAELTSNGIHDLLSGDTKAAATVLNDKKTAVKHAQAFVKHANRTNGANGLDAMLKLTKGKFYIDQEMFDSRPNEINTPDGVINLISGEVYPHSDIETRYRYHTKTTRCAPSNTGMEEWMEFLRAVCCGDASLMCYLMMLFGMAAFGKVYEEGIYFALGSGANGKSTFFNAIMAVLSDYAGNVDINVITSTASNKDPIIATMQGKRLIVAGELEERKRLSPAVVKQISSTDPITVNPKYVDPITFTPSHTLTIYTNHLPNVDSRDKGTWRRIHILPFNATFTGKDRKPNYAAELVTHCGGAIMRWIVEGAKLFAENGFKLYAAPDVVAQATEEYRDREDWLQNFLEDCCILEDGARVGSQALYDAYKDWMIESGQKPMRISLFNQAMDDAGYHKVTPKNQKMWCNVRLMPKAISGLYA